MKTVKLLLGKQYGDAKVNLRTIVRRGVPVTAAHGVRVEHARTHTPSHENVVCCMTLHHTDGRVCAEQGCLQRALEGRQASGRDG